MATWPEGAAAAAAWKRAGPPAVTEAVTLSVRYDAQGALEWVREVGGSSPAGQRLAKEVAGLLTSAGRPATGVRLRFSPEGPPVVVPAIACEAALPPGARFTSGPPLGIDYSALPRGGGPTRYTVDVSVGSDGHPVTAVIRGRSTAPGSIGAHLVSSAMAHRYLPALQDGFPVPGSYSYSLKVQVRVTRTRSGP